MATEKVSITVDSELLDWARAQHPNLSAFLNEALAAQVRREGLRKVLAELDKEYGPVDAAEELAASRDLERAWQELEGTESAGEEAPEDVVKRALIENPAIADAVVTVEGGRAYVVAKIAESRGPAAQRIVSFIRSQAGRDAWLLLVSESGTEGEDPNLVLGPFEKALSET